MYGIDISQHQRGLVLSSVQADFVIIKATEGVGFKDPQFDVFISQALALGKRIGVYHFARPYAQNFNNPRSEADWFFSVVQPYIGRVMLILDWEAERKYDVEWAKAWLDRVKELSGVTPVFYSYESCVNSYNWSSVAYEYPLWVARYLDYVPDYNYDMSGAGPKPKVRWWNKYIMWQWTSSGRLDNWGGNLDFNIFYEDDWDRYCSSKGKIIVPDNPGPEPKSDDPNDLSNFTDDELAQRVMEGVYGNGEDRRNALGVRYGAVQKIVNQAYANKDTSPVFYTVVPGDTLGAIAQKFGTTYQRIALDNGINNPNLIYPGQRFVIKK